MKIFNMVMVLLCVTFFSASVAAAGYIKFDGVDGESTDSEHEKWIDVLNVDWGMHLPQNATGQSRRRGGVIVEDISFSANFNLASPVLMQMLARGQVLPSAEIEFVDADGDRKSPAYLKYVLTNVRITGYEFSVGADGLPVDNFSFNFEEIELDYISPTGDSSMFQWSNERGR